MPVLPLINPVMKILILDRFIAFNALSEVPW